MNQRLLITILIALFLMVGTYGAIKFSQGYRFDYKQKRVAGTGLLVANSQPKGASVFINDKLTTATDDTLNLPPGDYQIKIVKDGFISWEKKLKLEKELVTQTNCHLFPAVPDLKSLTTAGALNLAPSPDGQSIAFSVASASARPKNGLWIIDLSTATPLSLSREPRQISQTTSVLDFTQAQLTWSPDSKQILAWTKTDAILLSTDRYNDPQEFMDVAARLPIILKEWEDDLKLKKAKQLEKLPPEMQKILAENATDIYFSPDEEKVMYTATASANIRDQLIPPVPASNSQPEKRNLEPQKIYVYDRKEDKNFYLLDMVAKPEPAKPKKLTKEQEEELALQQRIKTIQDSYSPLYASSLQWFPSSQHLILTEKDKMVILEYDNTNRSTVYAGPFSQGFVYPWPDASKLLILTTLNPDSPLPPNLYAIDLK